MEAHGAQKRAKAFSLGLSEPDPGHGDSGRGGHCGQGVGGTGFPRHFSGSGGTGFPACASGDAVSAGCRGRPPCLPIRASALVLRKMGTRLFLPTRKKTPVPVFPTPRADTARQRRARRCRAPTARAPRSISRPIAGFLHGLRLSKLLLWFWWHRLSTPLLWFWWHTLSSLCFGRRAASPLQVWRMAPRWVAGGGHGGPPLQSLATRGLWVVGAGPRA